MSGQGPICRVHGGGGLIFPLGGTAEREWSDSLRAVLYAVAMIYWFLGLSIVADVFMAAVEKVTSQRKKVSLPNGTMRTVKVWNRTVASLTLMAFGSSAPEILLPVIDIFKKEFHSSDLGPATIVGSASVDLLVICAVCIAVIPKGETRRIFNFAAFYITAIFSVAAYVWVVIMLAWASPDIVEVWEAALTFLMLPGLVWVAYMTDIGAFDRYFRMVRLIPAEAEEEQNPYGFMSFTSDLLTVQGSERGSTAEVAVIRRKVSLPSSDPVVVRWRTESATAVPGYDFEEGEGSFEFATHDTEKIIELTVLGKHRRISDCEFLVILSDLQGGPMFDTDCDGVEGEAILTVRIARHGPEASGIRRALHAMCNLDTLRLGFYDWKEQAWNSIFVNGGLEEQRKASWADCAVHLVAFPWKVAFGLMPPTGIFGGWPCVIASLIGIGVLTVCISDLAELFGCVLGIADFITGVTFVALGTSMPNLFAMFSAAKDPMASIVNVTRNNAVNVFLGLGVPWLIASLYWSITGRTRSWEEMYPEVASRISGPAFVVEAHNLGFSMGAFSYVCALAVAVLYHRRRWLRCELGGPLAAKWAASVSFVFLWLLWVVAVIFRVVDQDARPATNAGLVGGCAGTGLLLTLATLILTWRARAMPVFEEREEHHSSTGVGDRPTAVHDPARWAKAPPLPEATAQTSPGKLQDKLADDTGGQTGSEDKLADDTGGQTGSEASDMRDYDVAGDLGQEKSRAPTETGIRRSPSSGAALSSRSGRA